MLAHVTLHTLADFVSCLTDHRICMSRHFPVHRSQHLGKHQPYALLFAGVHGPNGRTTDPAVERERVISYTVLLSF